MAIVYCAQNLINGKRYIGVTVQGLRVRRRGHINDAKSRKKPCCRVFGAAIRKYGAESFEWSTLGEYEDGAAAYRAEMVFIRDLKPEYNIALGGNCGSFGVPRTQQWKDRISKGLLGKALSHEHKMKSLAGLEAGREKRRRPVVCLEDGKWFRGMREAEIFYGMPKASIRNIFDRNQTKTHGLHFVESKTEISGKERLMHLRKFEARIQAEKDRLKRGTQNKPVRCLPEGIEFKSVCAAAAHYGLTAVTVHLKLKTGEPTIRRPKGLMFRYI